MPEHKITCPSCKTVLKSAQPLPPGKKIKCPKCQQVFMTAPAAPAAPEVAEEIVPAAAVPPPPRRPAREPQDDDTVPLTRRKGPPSADDDPKRRPANKKNLGMIMACVGGGSFVGMFIFMILSFVFAASAVSGQFRNLQNQFPQPKGQFNIDPKEVDDAMKKALENMPKG